MPQTISFETGLRRFIRFIICGLPDAPALPFPELFLRFAVSVLLTQLADVIFSLQQGGNLFLSDQLRRLDGVNHVIVRFFHADFSFHPTVLIAPRQAVIVLAVW